MCKIECRRRTFLRGPVYRCPCPPGTLGRDTHSWRRRRFPCHPQIVCPCESRREKLSRLAEDPYSLASHCRRPLQSLGISSNRCELQSHIPSCPFPGPCCSPSVCLAFQC